MGKKTFTATVRNNPGMIKAGKIVSVQLHDFNNKIVKVTIEEMGDGKNGLDKIREG